MKSLKATYDHLTTDREGFLAQAREHSELTIPSLVPPDGTSTSYNELYKPYQSAGASGVNGLANKLTGALYPAQQPFFRFLVKPTAEELEGVTQEILDATDISLAEIEQDVMEQFTKRGDRAAITETLKHLIVAGNSLLYVGDERSRIYPLDRYVAERDGEGNLLRAITLDVLDYETFKEKHGSIQAVHDAHQGNRSWAPRTIEVYTVMERVDGRWELYEEAAGEVIPGTKRTAPLEEPPMLALRFNRLDGQSYGRGYVENLFGDLRSLENLSQSVVEGSALSARVIFLIDPNGFTSQRAFEKASNGAVLPGNAQDVTTAKVDKGADLGVAANQIDRLEARLNAAFLDRRSMQRDAERVTAREIEEMTAEIEEVLGGVYAVLAEEFQRPYAQRLISLLQKKGLIAELDKTLIDISIVTGVSAIGRGTQQQKMGAFFQALAQTFGPESIQEYVNVPAAVSQLAASFGIKTKGLIKSPEQIQQEKAEAQEAQMAQQMAPAAAGAMGDIVKQSVDNQQQQEMPEDGAQIQ